MQMFLVIFWIKRGLSIGDFILFSNIHIYGFRTRLFPCVGKRGIILQTCTFPQLMFPCLNLEYKGTRGPALVLDLQVFLESQWEYKEISVLYLTINRQ